MKKNLHYIEMKLFLSGNEWVLRFGSGKENEGKKFTPKVFNAAFLSTRSTVHKSAFLQLFC